MSDTSRENKAEQIKLSELLLSAKNLSRQIEKIRKSRLMGEKVIDLEEYKAIRMEQPQKAVLLIDEDEELLDNLRGSLDKYGFGIITAMNPRELALVIEDQNFDMIVLDIRLSWLDGYEFCSVMKNHRLLRDIPIILLKEDLSKDEIRRGFEAGCDEYLPKPIEPKNLARNIRFILDY